MKKIFMITLGMLAFTALIYAQAPIDMDAEMIDATKPNPSVIYPVEVFPVEVVQGTVHDPSPIAVKYSPDVFEELRADLLRGSFSQDAAWNWRNNFGFSLGAHEGYYFGEDSIDNPLSGSNEKDSSYATSLSASVFTNYASGKTAMHLDYGAGYRFYPDQQNSADNINHSVNAAYIYRINNRARFQLRDQFISYSNDPLKDISSMNSSWGMSGSHYYDAILTRKRYSRNNVSADFYSDVTGKGTNVRLFGSYMNYWYGDQDFGAGTLEDYYSARIGAGLNQRITSWLSLGSTYSIQLNNDLKDSQIHRVEVGRIQFDLTPDIEVYVSGGVEISEKSTSEEGYRVRPTARVGISYTTPINRLYADYSRSMMSVSGFNRLLPSDTVTVGLGQPLGNRVNLRVMGYYLRSSDYNDSGHMSAFQAQASMEFIRASGLVASANYTYRYMENFISSLSGIPYYERSTVSGGLQYTWPSRRSR
jgi:hypothetical protein